MKDVIGKLTADQALTIVNRLGRKKGAVRDVVLEEAMKILTDVDPDRTATQVFAILESLDVEECWDRSGRSRDGYTDPSDAATDMIEEELRPFFDQVDQYHALGLTQEETSYCMGVVLGLYWYEREAESEFRDLCEDIPPDFGGALLFKWQKRTSDKTLINAMQAFIGAQCHEWAGFLKVRRA